MHTIRGVHPYGFIYCFTDFFEGRDIQSCDQLVVKSVHVMEKHGHGVSGHLLDDINVSGHAEFPELVPKHRSVESELSSLGPNRLCDVTTRRTLTLTRPCQFASVAFPAFKAERIRGTFFIPPS
jgi:hypothetical protein